ncbi:MAG: hypothetical protein PHD37_08630 [Gallionellaceae bacterium]|nr:hypothetical protein [Gallionellaceae bacterium]
MAATVSARLAVLSTGLLLISLAGCASDRSDLLEQQRHEQIDRNLEGLKQGLRAGTWSKVERFFSPAYQEGYGELRDRLEARFRDEQIIDLQFTINRILENDGLLNVQVRWHKAWVDRGGKPGKREGVSEFILRQRGESYRILNILGDHLF